MFLIYMFVSYVSIVQIEECQSAYVGLCQMSMSLSIKNLYSANSRGRIWGAGMWVTRCDKQKQKGKI